MSLRKRTTTKWRNHQDLDLRRCLCWPKEVYIKSRSTKHKTGQWFIPVFIKVTNFRIVRLFFFRCSKIAIK